jgi:hypothetical protein
MKPSDANTRALGRSLERDHLILQPRVQRSGRKSMADVTYVSRVRVEPVKGRVRRAYVPAEEEPVLFGVHDEVAAHYGVEPGAEEPHASTLDYVVAAAGG